MTTDMICPSQPRSGVHWRFFPFCIILSIILAHPIAGQEGNDPDETRLLNLIDSMKSKLLEYNYYDSINNEPSFFSFPKDIMALSQKAENAGFEKAYYHAENVRMLYYKYNGVSYRVFEILDSGRDRAFEKGQTMHQARFTYLKGTEHSRNDNYDSAINYYNEAYLLADSIAEMGVKAAAVNALAVTYAQLFEEENALKYYKEALKLSQATDNLNQLMIILGNLGNTYAKMGQGDSAMFYGKWEYDLAVQEDDLVSKRQALNVMVRGSYLNQDYNQAIGLTQEIYELVSASGEVGFLITPYLYRSKSYAAMGRDSRARTDAKESLRLAREVGYLAGEINALEWQVQLHKDNSEYQAALDTNEQLQHLRDSLAEANNQEKLEQMAMNYEIRERENKIKALRQIQNADAKRIYFKNLVIVAVIVVLVVSTILMFILYKRRIEKQKSAMQEAKNQLLRSQLNPHFLFNALSSIQLFLINKGQGKEALEYLSKFAKLMRRILENSRESFVSLENEVSTLRHYLDLQKVRFDNKFEYNIQMDIESDPADIMIPPMFAQPFIENSLEHGISHRDDGLIQIWFKVEGDSLNFRVEDNGIGITRSAKLSKPKEHQSLATVITKDRIRLLRKQLKRQISFDVRDKRDEQEQVTGTEVLFELPIMYRFS